MDLELRVARLQAELDAFRQRRGEEREESNAQLLMLQEHVAAQAAALLVLTNAAAVLPEETQTAVPDALLLWATELRLRNEERGAIAAEALADLLLRTRSAYTGQLKAVSNS